MQGFIEPGGFARDVVGVCELRLDAHTELVTAVAGKSQPLAVVGDDFDCHRVAFGCIRATKKPVGQDGRVVDGPCWTVGERKTLPREQKMGPVPFF